jgi:hypothetical protein
VRRKNPKISSKKKVVKKNPQPEIAVSSGKKEKREKLQAKIKESKRRGNKVDFSKLRLGSKTERGKRIVLCPECGRKGELSAALRPSPLIIHRGRILTGETQIRMTDFCVGYPGALWAPELHVPVE